MHLKRMFRTTGVVVIASLSSAAAAQTGTLTGTVVNIETEKLIPDVVVTATSPALQGEQVVVTDAEGQYRIPELPPGTYTLRFDKEGFKPYSRAELTVGPDLTVQTDAALLPESGYKEIEFDMGCGGSVDTSSSTTRTNVEEAFTRRLALNQPRGRGGAARSFENLAELAPGVEGDADGVSIHGASPFENAYVVDGLFIQDPVSGVNPLPLSVEFLQDLDILTAGVMPEHGRTTGGIIQARTRSGSNEFHGSVFGNWVPGLLGGTSTPVSDSNLIISTQNALKHQGDIGATLGGPLLKDRLWFFAGVVPSGTRLEHRRILSGLVPGEDGTYEPQPIPGSSQTFLFDQRGLQALGKLTYRLDSDHSFSLSAITTPNRSSLADPSSEFLGVSESNFTTSAFTYAGAFMERRLLIDARLGWSHWTDSSPSLVNDSTAIDRYQANVQASWQLALAGIHVFEAGVDADRPTSTRTWSFQGAPPTLGQTSTYATQLFGGFVQDSWTLFNRVTLNAGLRYDTQWVYTGEGERALAFDHQLSPRVGLVVDPTAQGRMKLFAHYAKYPGQLPLSLMQRTFAPEQWPANSANVDPELVAPTSSELVAGAEYQVLRATRLSATYTHRRLDSVIEDMSRDDGNTWFLGNPGSGLAREFPKAERTYEGLTVALNRVFAQGWLAQASYTWSRLEGNYSGPAQSDFELVSLTKNRSGLLPYDRTHSVKLFGAKAFHLTQDLSANLGLSYRGRSGTPLNYLGAHPLYGPGETFVLPRGSSGERTPWVHTLDSNVGLTYRLGGSKAVSLTVDLFNLFNFQVATRVDQHYTYASVLPVTEPVEPGTLTPGRVTKIDEHTGQPTPLRADDLNRNFRNPVEYQAPRQVRLGLRYSF